MNKKYLIAFLFIIIVSPTTLAYSRSIGSDGKSIYTIPIQDSHFQTSSIEIWPGDTVEWVNDDPDNTYSFLLHQPLDFDGAIIDEHIIERNLPPGGKVNYTFDYGRIPEEWYAQELKYNCIKLSGLRSDCPQGTLHIYYMSPTEWANSLKSQGEITSKPEETITSDTANISPTPKETKTIEPTITEPEIKPTSNIIIQNKKYFLIGLVVLIMLAIGGYGLKFIKNKPKAKQKKEVKEVEVEESKPEISEDIKEVISVSNFTLKYGQKMILENVNFEINKGEMVCLLGPSGTGKSTIIEALVGRKTPTKGTLKILGKDISKDKDIFDYVGFVPQHSELYMNQTVEQNLLSSATKWGIKNAKEKAEKILSKIDLSHRKDLKASKLSGGQQKLLSLGMELIRDIEVCILDEPTTGLDPTTRNNIITILSHISSQFHKTILFTTHFMDDAEECDNVIILADKKIVAQGPPQKLEKMLPGGGKVVSIVLDNVTEDLLEKIEKIDGVKKIIREGRTLKIISNEPNTVRMGHKIDEIGGSVNEAKMDRATMMEVFVYHTGKKPE